jgi:hypothetical protein
MKALEKVLLKQHALAERGSQALKDDYDDDYGKKGKRKKSKAKGGDDDDAYDTKAAKKSKASTKGSKKSKKAVEVPVDEDGDDVGSSEDHSNMSGEDGDGVRYKKAKAGDFDDDDDDDVQAATLNKRRRRRRKLSADALEQRRKEELQEKRMRKLEEQQSRELRQQLQAAESARKAQLRAQMRDLDRQVRVTKEILLKHVKRRREEVKFRIEYISDHECHAPGVINDPSLQFTLNFSPKQEKVSNIATTDSFPNSSKFSVFSTGMIRISSDTYGKILELWNFLHTFHSVLDLAVIPSLDDFVCHFRALDPLYRMVMKYTLTARKTFHHRVLQYDKRYHTYSRPDDGLELCNKIGITIAQHFIKDYNRYMTIDQAEGSIGTCSVPVNLLTWREIIRWGVYYDTLMLLVTVHFLGLYCWVICVRKLD